MGNCLFLSYTSNDKTCRQCANRERWQCGGKVFSYCKARKSNRTDNGLKKVKCKDKACGLFKEIDETKQD